MYEEVVRDGIACHGSSYCLWGPDFLKQTTTTEELERQLTDCKLYIEDLRERNTDLVDLHSTAFDGDADATLTSSDSSDFFSPRGSTPRKITPRGITGTTPRGPNTPVALSRGQVIGSPSMESPLTRPRSPDQSTHAVEQVRHPLLDLTISISSVSPHPGWLRIVSVDAVYVRVCVSPWFGWGN
jgi:hypothetical protein